MLKGVAASAHPKEPSPAPLGIPCAEDEEGGCAVLPRLPFHSLPGCVLTEVCQNGYILAKHFHFDKLAFSNNNNVPPTNPNRELERFPHALALSETVPISNCLRKPSKSWQAPCGRFWMRSYLSNCSR